MEVPSLTWSTILFLNNKVSTREVVNVSTLSKSGNDIEVSINDEAPFSIPLSLGWFTLPVFDIDEIPLLVGSEASIVLFVHVDVSIFGISLT
jgi:hypothetical protein